MESAILDSVAMSAELGAFGLYVHIPFCVRRCPYCDFNTYAGLEPLYQRTVDALCVDLDRWGERLQNRPVTSVFVGGGTPTALSNPQLSQLFAQLQSSFNLSSDCEITVEANPGTVDQAKFANLRSLGVNRLSMGVQSLQPDELSFLGRVHSADEATHAFQLARDVGFENISLDFIFGVANQTRDNWADTLTRAVELTPEHLSLYSLIVEPNTPLHNWVASGRVTVPDDDAAGDLYEYAIAELQKSGYRHYEVSNWAKPKDEDAITGSPHLACRHNLLYWRNGEYVGIGPGAHSHLRIETENENLGDVQRGGGSSTRTKEKVETVVSRRWSSVKPVLDYVERIETGQSVEDFREELTQRESMGETMMLSLRLLCEGVRHDLFERLHGVRPVDAYPDELTRLETDGLLTVDDDAIRLTHRGLMLANQVSLAFISSAD